MKHPNTLSCPEFPRWWFRPGIVILVGVFVFWFIPREIVLGAYNGARRTANELKHGLKREFILREKRLTEGW